MGNHSTHERRNQGNQTEVAGHSGGAEDPRQIETDIMNCISSGLQIKSIVAVDFTVSNGCPVIEDSLHYINPTEHILNDYQQVIKDVGDVLHDHYQSTSFRSWGFGARVNGSISHCFDLYGTDEVHDVEGIMTAYASTFDNVALSGPGKFREVIDKAARIASEPDNSTSYYVLLILTDGVPKDLGDTKKALVKASEFPLFVFIVGIGDADFKKMKKLVTIKRIGTRRNMVHFASFKRGSGNGLVGDFKEMLDNDFKKYMLNKGPST